MTRQNKLDIVLAYMSKNMMDIPARPDQICERAGLKIERAEAFLILDMMCVEGYVARSKPDESYYVAQYKGIIFLDNGGYTLQHQHYKRQKLAQKISDYVDIVVKPVGIFTATSVSVLTILQILRLFGIFST